LIVVESRMVGRWNDEARNSGEAERVDRIEHLTS
jgi:hypothetical protein